MRQIENRRQRKKVPAKKEIGNYMGNDPTDTGICQLVLVLTRRALL